MQNNIVQRTQVRRINGPPEFRQTIGKIGIVLNVENANAGYRNNGQMNCQLPTIYFVRFRIGDQNICEIATSDQLEVVR